MGEGRALLSGIVIVGILSRGTGVLLGQDEQLSIQVEHHVRRWERQQGRVVASRERGTPEELVAHWKDGLDGSRGGSAVSKGSANAARHLLLHRPFRHDCSRGATGHAQRRQALPAETASCLAR